jgi:hypothetical protein
VPGSLCTDVVVMAEKARDEAMSLRPGLEAPARLLWLLQAQIWTVSSGCLAKGTCSLMAEQVTEGWGTKDTTREGEEGEHKLPYLSQITRITGKGDSQPLTGATWRRWRIAQHSCW